MSAPACLYGGIGCQLTRRAVDVTPPHSTEDGPSSGAIVSITDIKMYSVKKLILIE